MRSADKSWLFEGNNAAKKGELLGRQESLGLTSGLLIQPIQLTLQNDYFMVYTKQAMLHQCLVIQRMHNLCMSGNIVPHKATNI